MSKPKSVALTRSAEMNRPLWRGVMYGLAASLPVWAAVVWTVVAR